MNEIDLNDPVAVAEAVHADYAAHDARKAVEEMVWDLGIRHSPSIAQLTAALAKASLEFGETVKDTSNPFYKSTYIDLADLIKATRPALGKHGLIVLQPARVGPDGPIVTTIISHSSGEWIADDLSVPVVKRDAQGIGSAITYARRYAYQSMLNLAGEEDDDANAAVASRKEHLDQLTEKMASQERIPPPMATAFLDAAKKSGKTLPEISQYLMELGNYAQAEEILKQEYNAAIKWALSKPAAPAQVSRLETDQKTEDLAPLLQESVKEARKNRFSNLFAAASKKKPPINNDDLHKAAAEMFKVESLTQLNGQQLNQLIKWVEEQ